MGEREKNLKAYKKMRQELETKFWGKCVAIAKGELIVTAETIEEAMTKANQIAPSVSHKLVFQVGKEYPKIEELI